MMQFEQEKTRCGTVAIVGRPNVGKSTLMNYILGEKLSITSAKPQTTRQQILGIKTEAMTQTIYIDTPGLPQASQNRLQRSLVRDAVNVVAEVDVVGFVIEAGRWTEADQTILERLREQNQPVILILNKVDRAKDKSRLLPFMKNCAEKMNFLAMIPVSAQKGDNMRVLEETIAQHLPCAEFVYPRDQLSDRSQRFLASEFIREKLMRALHKEIPYGVSVVIEQFEEKKRMIHIHAVILATRLGQKAIIIGKGGEVLKKIGSQARLDMEACFKKKVYLNLWVKVQAKSAKKSIREGSIKGL